MSGLPRAADIVVIGAGVAGLACARSLRAAGRSPLILERARGVGGRCATRRVHEQPVDHGLAFLHTHLPEVAADIEGIGGVTLLEGWPRRVEGSGTPCQPRAFLPGARRFAISEGLSAWPKSLARGLDVRCGVRVNRLRPDPEGFRLEFHLTDPAEDTEAPLASAAGPGEELLAREVVLALPGGQALPLLEGLPDNAEQDLRAARTLLGMLGSASCLTVLAGYPARAPRPDWEICYPEDSPVLQTIVHDSSKRKDARSLILVLQAQPCWSRRERESARESWAGAMIQEVGRLLGSWAAQPAWTQAHRWRYARTDPGNELSGPMLFDLGGGRRLGLAGEVFHPGSGVEAAWMSGVRLSRRMATEAAA